MQPYVPSTQVKTDDMLLIQEAHCGTLDNSSSLKGNVMSSASMMTSMS